MWRGTTKWTYAQLYRMHYIFVNAYKETPQTFHVKTLQHQQLPILLMGSQEVGYRWKCRCAEAEERGLQYWTLTLSPPEWFSSRMGSDVTRSYCLSKVNSNCIDHKGNWTRFMSDDAISCSRYLPFLLPSDWWCVERFTFVASCSWLSLNLPSILAHRTLTLTISFSKW